MLFMMSCKVNDSSNGASDSVNAAMRVRRGNRYPSPNFSIGTRMGEKSRL